MDIDKTFSKFATRTARITGAPTTFLVCVGLVLLWAVSGPVFGFSETWQLVINTGTTIITFLMVFLIQNTQNRDSTAVQAKLDELILSSMAENEFVGIEELSDEQLQSLHKRCTKAAKDHTALGDKLHGELSRRSGESRPASKRAPRKTASRPKSAKPKARAAS